jgi:peptidoglycan hydrolase-like protein with peptidoglycan-binding domain
MSNEEPVLSGVGVLRNRVALLAVMIVGVLTTGSWVALTHASAQPSRSADPDARPVAEAGKHQGPSRSAAGPLRVLSVTPAAGAAGVNGAAPVRVNFSAALAAGSPMPAITPRIAGRWQQVGGTAIQFVPKRGFRPLTPVRVRIPAGRSGVRSAGGGLLAAKVTVRFHTGRYSITRLEQLLAQLGYLPLDWTPASPPSLTDGAAQRSAAYQPPAGTFAWQGGYPLGLRRFWQNGSPGSMILSGAVMAFENDHGMAMDGVVGAGVWQAMFRAVAADQRNTHGYTYARASETFPETLTVWHNGHVVLRSLANTGIPVAPTTIGTAPVYLRYQFQIMKGTNPDGTKYADPVSYVAYFRAGEAVHYFPRGSYGSEQSLGCVELPLDAAKRAWPYLSFGSLVTVTPPKGA